MPVSGLGTLFNPGISSRDEESLAMSRLDPVTLFAIKKANINKKANAGDVKARAMGRTPRERFRVVMSNIDSTLEVAILFRLTMPNGREMGDESRRGRGENCEIEKGGKTSLWWGFCCLLLVKPLCQKKSITICFLFFTETITSFRQYKLAAQGGEGGGLERMGESELGLQEGPETADRWLERH